MKGRRGVPPAKRMHYPTKRRFSTTFSPVFDFSGPLDFILHNSFRDNGLQIVIHIFHRVFHTRFFLLFQRLFRFYGENFHHRKPLDPPFEGGPFSLHNSCYYRFAVSRPLRPCVLHLAVHKKGEPPPSEAAPSSHASLRSMVAQAFRSQSARRPLKYS